MKRSYTEFHTQSLLQSDSHSPEFFLSFLSLRMAEMRITNEIQCCPGKTGALAWLTEVLIRLVLGIVFLLSATVIQPFLRIVQREY